MNNNIEDFYNSIPWRIKEDAKFPANFSSMNPEQRRFVKNLYDYERNWAEKEESVINVKHDVELIAEEVATVMESIDELRENLKKVVS